MWCASCARTVDSGSQRSPMAEADQRPARTTARQALRAINRFRSCAHCKEFQRPLRLPRRIRCYLVVEANGPFQLLESSVDLPCNIRPEFFIE